MNLWRRHGVDGLCLLACATAMAQPIPWHGPTFMVASTAMPLSAVLQTLGGHYGLAVIVSPKIDDRFSGTLQDLPKGQALATLARRYDLVPYYDGGTLYVYKSQEMDSTVVLPNYLDAKALQQALAHSTLLDGLGCQTRVIGGNHALQVVGVPVCLARVGSLAKQLDEQNLNQEQNKEVATLFPLKYANAADLSYAYRSEKVTVPGVASLLRDMVSGHSLPLPENKSPLAGNVSALPTFAVDPRQNAVLVRDRQQNMPLYHSLIAQLDQRPSLIEISVNIIDVDAADVNQLGIDWSGAAKIGGGGVSFNADSSLNSDSFSSVVANSSGFMVRLNALAQKARARIVSRPSVVTLDNIQAILDRNVTFYTKLSGKDTVQLASITAGELMRVTPRIIHEPEGDKVLLTLNIQDGRQDQPLSEAESLPQVQNAEIATQATLKLGQALLLGGFVQNENIEGERKIPLLGDIPLLGRLFRSTAQTERNVVRLFLIKAEPRTL